MCLAAGTFDGCLKTFRCHYSQSVSPFFHSFPLPLALDQNATDDVVDVSVYRTYESQGHCALIAAAGQGRDVGLLRCTFVAAGLETEKKTLFKQVEVVNEFGCALKLYALRLRDTQF